VSGWLNRLVACPIADGERRRAFLIGAAVLVIAAAGLSFAHHPHTPSPAHLATSPNPTAPASPSPSPPAAPVAIPAPGGGTLTGVAPAAAMAAGRAFLLSYLRFTYGQAPPRFPSATADLASELARFHVAISPAQRARSLSLLALRASRRDGGWEVGALADDGAASFPVAAILERQHGRWLAVRLVTASTGGGP